MKPQRAAWALVASAGLALLQAGCGGGSKPAGNAPAAGSDTAQQAPDAPAPQDATVQVAEAPAPTPAPGGDSATDELLAMSGGQGGAPPAGGESAGGTNPSAPPSGYPGASGGAPGPGYPGSGGGPPAGYPGSGGGGPPSQYAQGRPGGAGGAPAGYPGSGGGGAPGAGYPGASGGAPGAGGPPASGGPPSSGAPGPGYPGSGGGPPAGYPGSGGGGPPSQYAQGRPGGAGGGPPAGYPGSGGGGAPGAGYPGAGGANSQYTQQGRPGRGGAPAGYPGSGGGAPGAGMVPGGGLGGAGGTPKEPDFSDPIKAAETFLAAVENKNLTDIANTIALRAEFEAPTDKKKAMFKALKEESIAQEELDEIARNFDGMKIMNVNEPRSSGTRGVIVGKTDENKLITRTLYLRREKDGWKIVDFGAPRTQPIGIRNRGQAGGGQGQNKGG